jgi:hypothetical protein
MDRSGIQGFFSWRDLNGTDVDQIISVSRQFSHISGVSLEPKGRWKKEKGESFIKFSVRPKPLKWRGSNGWDRVVVIIKRSGGGEMFFVASLDGIPISMGNPMQWNHIRKAKQAMEAIHNKLKKEENHDG